MQFLIYLFCRDGDSDSNSDCNSDSDWALYRHGLTRLGTHVFLIDWHFLVGSIRLAKSSEFLEAASQG